MRSIVVCLFFLSGPVWAIVAPITLRVLKQPDGLEFRARLRGDEWTHWWELENGFSIIQRRDGAWVFARGIENGRLAPSDIRVVSGQQDPAGEGLTVARGLRPPSGPEFPPARPASLTKVSGDFHVPLLLVDYPDMAHEIVSGEFNSQMNDSGWDGTGSLRDFYEEISYDQFHLITTVNGWYRADEAHDYYGNNQPWDRVLQLVRSLVDDAEAAGFDFSQFDNDGDGDVDALNVIHSGGGGETGDSTSIWSHRWALSAGGFQVVYDGVLINDYTIQPELLGTDQASIGVISHEFGHALGLPDLYDTDYSSAGAGNWTLMAGGAWGADGASPWYPAHLDPWGKTELGWATPTLITADTTGVSLPAVEFTPQVLRINHPIDPSEYFLLENRQKVGFDVNLYSSGLLIWHIDTEQLASGAVNSAEPHYAVGVEQADGDFDLENNQNRGDPGDPYPGLTGNSVFDDDSTPNSHSYYSVPSMIAISGIQEGGGFVSFNVDAGSSSFVVGDVGTGTAAPWDTVEVPLTLDNTIEVSGFSCVLADDPDRLILIGAETTDRTVGMMVTVEEIGDGMGRVVITGGTIPTGTGAIATLKFFTYTGTAGSVTVSMASADAFDLTGGEIGVSLGSGTVGITSAGYQYVTLGTAAASPGETALIPVALDNTVGVAFIVLHLKDTPNVLALYTEPFTDSDGDGQWEEGEPFEDVNQDGSWTGKVTLSDRFAGDWIIGANETAGKIIFVAANWSEPLQPDSSVLLHLNVRVSESASAGAIPLQIPTLILKVRNDEEALAAVGVEGSFTVLGLGTTRDDQFIPTEFALGAPVPNPFNALTTLTVALPTAARTRVAIHDLLGRTVAVLANGALPAGRHVFRWNGRNDGGRKVASGIYICRMEADRSGLEPLFFDRKLVLVE